MAEDRKRRRIFQALAGALAADWVKGGILAAFPTASAALTAFTAYTRAVPLWQIITASMLTFASAVTVIRGFVEISFRIRIKGRLTYAGAQCLIHQKTSGIVDKLGLALNVQNQSLRAMEYQVTEVHQVIDGRVNPAPTTHSQPPTTISPGMIMQYRADMVDVATPKAGKMLDYTYIAKMRYGEPGDMRYETEVRLRGTYSFKTPSEIGVFEAFIA